MSRKVTVDVRVKLTINADEGIDISEVLAEMDYDFTSNTDGADVQDTEIDDWEIVDSK